MSQNIEKLRADARAAEERAQKLMQEKDDALAKVRERFGDRLRKANDEAALTQKAVCDAEAAEALLDRPDGRELAASLGLTLPE